INESARSPTESWPSEPSVASLESLQIINRRHSPCETPRSRPGRSLPQSKWNRSIYVILGGLLDIANRNLWNRLGKAAFTRHCFTNSAHWTRRRNSFRAPTSLFQRSILFG